MSQQYQRRNGRKLSKNTQQQVRQIARRTLSQMSEKKYHDAYSTAGTVSFSGGVTELADVSQGSTDLTRVGDKIRITSLQGKFAFTLGTSPNAVRLVVFQWIGDNTPVVSDIFSAVHIGSVRAPFSPFKHDSKSLYRILYDSGVLTVDTYNTIVSRKFLISKRNMKKMNTQVNYNAGGTTGTNKLYLLAISDDGAAAYPTTTWVTRMKFVDF